MYEGTKYFFTVRAYNYVGLHSTLSSDGFVIDDTKPYPGVVFNTDRHSNVRHQSQTNSVSASWHGFEDQHSHIKRYEVSVVLGNKTTIRVFQSVGLLSSVNITGIHLETRQDYHIVVKAVDAAGYESDHVHSNKFQVDPSPPVGVECHRFEQLVEIENASSSNINFNVSLMKDNLNHLYLRILNASFNIRVTCEFNRVLMLLPIKLHQRKSQRRISFSSHL